VTAEVRTLFSPTTGRPMDQFDLAGRSAGLVQALRVDVREANTADAVVTVRFVVGATLLWLATALAALSALALALGAPAATEPER
jgi:hypothetical protein